MKRFIYIAALIEHEPWRERWRRRLALANPVRLWPWSVHGQLLSLIASASDRPYFRHTYLLADDDGDAYHRGWHALEAEVKRDHPRAVLLNDYVIEL